MKLVSESVAFKRAMLTTNRVTQVSTVPMLELASVGENKEEYLDYVKKEGAHRLVDFLIKEGYFPFKERKEFPVSSDTTYESELFVFTREDFVKFLEDYGVELVRETIGFDLR